MEYLISKEDLQKLGEYLVSKPWIEVNTLINILQNLKQAPVSDATNQASTQQPTLVK